jgi:hypothetical protein
LARFIGRFKLTTEKVNDIKSTRVEDIRDKVHTEPNAMKRAIIIQRLFKQTLNKQGLIPNRKRLLCAVSLVTVIASANIGPNPDETADYPPTRYSTSDPVLKINISRRRRFFGKNPREICRRTCTVARPNVRSVRDFPRSLGRVSSIESFDLRRAVKSYVVCFEKTKTPHKLCSALFITRNRLTSPC